MIVELRTRKRRRPRRAVIIFRVIVLHELSGLVDHHGNMIWDEDMVFEANQFVVMRWPRGPEAWDNVICRICNREFLWDKELHEKCPQCPHCADEIF